MFQAFPIFPSPHALKVSHLCLDACTFIIEDQEIGVHGHHELHGVCVSSALIISVCYRTGEEREGSPVHLRLIEGKGGKEHRCYYKTLLQETARWWQGVSKHQSPFFLGLCELSFLQCLHKWGNTHSRNLK